MLKGLVRISVKAVANPKLRWCCDEEHEKIPEINGLEESVVE
jgi:hypothetical protein